VEEVLLLREDVAGVEEAHAAEAADPSSGNSTSQFVISSLLPPTGKSMMPALGSLTVAIFSVGEMLRRE